MVIYGSGKKRGKFCGSVGEKGYYAFPRWLDGGHIKFNNFRHSSFFNRKNMFFFELWILHPMMECQFRNRAWEFSKKCLSGTYELHTISIMYCPIVMFPLKCHNKWRNLIVMPLCSNISRDVGHNLETTLNRQLSIWH